MTVQSNDVVITGAGIISPVGTGLAAFRESLFAGRCGIGEIVNFDASELTSHVAGEVADFQLSDHLDSVKFGSFESGYPVDVTLYACPECGARVEVDHLRDDLESWLSGDGEEW